MSLRHHSTTCYQYDALGRRTEKTTVHYDKYEKKQTTATISFDWQGLRLSGERTRIHPEQYVQYIYNEASYEPVARVIIHTSQNTHEQTEQLEYFHTLQSALPTELTNAEGDILWQADYRLFGELKVQQRRNRELYQQNLRFAGQYYDNETGLHYNTFRYYDPNCGRFTQQDPIGLAGGINLYQYAPNPLSWIDPLGLCFKFSNNFDTKLKKHAQDIYQTSRGLGVPVTKGDTAGMKNFILSIVDDADNLASSQPFKWNTIESTNAYMKGNALVLVNNNTNEILTFLHKDRISSYLTEIIK